MSDEIRHARELLHRERDAVVAALTKAALEAKEAARRQAEWKAEVAALLRRGRDAGITTTEMAKLLGLSRQWTTHLLACERAQVLDQVHANYHLVQRGSMLVQHRRNTR